MNPHFASTATDARLSIQRMRGAVNWAWVEETQQFCTICSKGENEQETRVKEETR